jgi:hypothetical protein
MIVSWKKPFQPCEELVRLNLGQCQKVGTQSTVYLPQCVRNAYDLVRELSGTRGSTPNVRSESDIEQILDIPEAHKEA